MTALLLLSLLGFIFMGVPIAASIGLASLVYILVNDLPIIVLVQRMFTGTDSIVLVAIPCFIVAGAVMEVGGLAKRLTSAADSIVGRITGGLSIVTIVTCMFFAAISGSGPATVAAIGGIMAPAMIEKGYKKGFSSAIVASAGGIGVIIPPSIPMVIYCVSSGVSITALFIAGFIPGILVGLLLMVYSWYHSKKAGYIKDETVYTRKDKLKILWDAKWSLLVPIIILGGIYGGIFTPTESAAVAVMYGFVIGRFVYKDLGNKEIIQVLRGAALTTGTVMIIMGTAATFGRILTLEQIPFKVAAAISAVSDSKLVILLLINLLLLLVGCFMETVAAIIILTPILLPIAVQVGVDPLHFGLIMVVNLAIGFITPPLGVNLFVACGITKMRLEDISKAIIYPLAFMIVALMLLTYIPDISMFLPRIILGYGA